MIRKYLQKIYLALIFILLYAPIVTLIVLSFNQSKTRAKWGGFTLKWYKELLKNEQIMSAFYTTLIIAFISAAIATVIGTAAAIAIQGMKQKWKTMYMGLTNIPMMKSGDRDGCVFDAPFYCISYDTWLRNDPDRTYYVQYSVCDLKRITEVEADEPLYI